MVEKETLSQRWDNYQPSKALWFWTTLGAVVATMVLGFTAGGWTTGGSAATMAEKAAHDARAELVASVCVENFTAQSDAATQFAALKETSSWQRDQFIEDGGWAMLAGMEKSVPGAADACASQLAAMDSLPPREVMIAPASTDS
ncbi:MAG: hypothetical protein M3Y78_15310 [Pseudomonadota bacterium]|nr:hypothetical protein [Pseudomonadota bacterium]